MDPASLVGSADLASGEAWEDTPAVSVIVVVVCLFYGLSVLRFVCSTVCLFYGLSVLQFVFLFRGCTSGGVYVPGIYTRAW